MELLLDDSVTVLRNLTIPAPSNDAVLTRKEFQSLIGSKVQEALLAVQDSQKKSSIPASNSNAGQNCRVKKMDSKNDKYNKNDNKRPILCFDCGVKGHKRGDLNFKWPRCFTKKRRGEFEDNEETPINRRTMTVVPFLSSRHRI